MTHRSLPSAAPRADSASQRAYAMLRAGLALVRLGPVLALAILVVAMSFASPVFLTEANLQNVGEQVTPILLLAIGQLIVILTRGIDLSVGSVVALATVVGATAAQHGASASVVILVMVVTGAGVGLVNGSVIVGVRIANPFIVTLAMLYIASGLAFVISDGETIIGVPRLVQDLGAGRIGALPTPLVFAAVVALLAGVLLKRLRWGRWIYLIGGNPEGARRAGIRVGAVLTSAYVVSGICAALAAVTVAGRTNSGYPGAGVQAELDSIAAVIVGGASFLGGRGTVANAIVGSFVLGVIRNGLNLLNVNPYLQAIASGGVLLGAVGLDVLRVSLEQRFRAAAAERGVTDVGH